MWQLISQISFILGERRLESPSLCFLTTTFVHEIVISYIPLGCPYRPDLPFASSPSPHTSTLRSTLDRLFWLPFGHDKSMASDPIYFIIIGDGHVGRHGGGVDRMTTSQNAQLLMHGLKSGTRSRSL